MLQLLHPVSTIYHTQPDFVCFLLSPCHTKQWDDSKKIVTDCSQVPLHTNAFPPGAESAYDMLKNNQEGEA